VIELRKRFGDIPLLYISIKPSIKRYNIIEQIRFTNKIISSEIKNMDDNVFFVNIFDKMLDTNRYPNRTLFQSEGLHMNEKGYTIWKDAIIGSFNEHNIHIQQ
jgi:lysophospholipase L1-like esterase